MPEICILLGMDNRIKCAVVAGVVSALVTTVAMSQCLIVTIFLDVMRTTLINSLAGHPGQPYIFNPLLNHNRLLLCVGGVGAATLGPLVGAVCGIASGYFFQDDDNIFSSRSR